MNNEENKIRQKNDRKQQSCIVEQVTNIDKFGACKVSDVGYCRHMVNYGYAKYCLHPNWRSFVEKESKEVII